MEFVALVVVTFVSQAVMTSRIYAISGLNKFVLYPLLLLNGSQGVFGVVATASIINRGI